MIVCQQCGYSNPSGTQWCQKPGCGAFLEFEGEKESTQFLPPLTGPPPTGTSSAGPAGQGQAGQGQAGQGQAEAAAAQEAQGQSQQGGGSSHIPPIRPGEIICPVCGWGNEPTRRFCRHDGAVLPGVAGAGQSPPVEAGRRNRRTRGTNKTVVALAILLPLLLVGGLVAGFLLLKPLGKHPAGAAGTKSPAAKSSPVPVPPGAVKILSFTSQSGAKVAKHTIDGDPDTFWSAAFPSLIPGNPRPDIDRHPKIRYGFNSPVTLTRVDIRNGASGAAFAVRPRAERIFLRFSDGAVQEATLADDGKAFQPVQIKAPREVSWVEIEISTSYPGSAAGDDKYRFSLAEVRFLTPAP